MTVEEMMRKITNLRQLASSIDGIATKEGPITCGDAQELEEAAEAIRDYIEELGRKKVV